MRGRNRSREVAQTRMGISHLNLLTFLLAGLLVLMMVGLSRSESWDEAIANAKKEGELVVVLGGAASRNYRPVFKFFEDKFGIRTVVSSGSGRRQANRRYPWYGVYRYG